MSESAENIEFYWEGPYLVFTALYHLRQGECCGSGCRHCPYDPKWTKGTTTPQASFDDLLQLEKLNLTGDEETGQG